jgi:hypothetical protein
VDGGRIVTSAGVSAGIDMALYLVSRLTDEAAARRIQLALDYDPEPPFGAIDWDHVDRLPKTMRRAIGLGAPFLAAKPKRLTRAERRRGAEARVSP